MPRLPGLRWHIVHKARRGGRPGRKGWQPGTSGGWPRARPPRCKCGGMCMTAGRKQRPGKGCKCADGKPCKCPCCRPTKLPPPGPPHVARCLALCTAPPNAPLPELGGDHREDGRQVQQEPPVRATCRARPRAKVGHPSPRFVRRPAQGRLAVYEDDAVQLQHLRVALLRPSARLDGRIGRPHRCATCARPVTGRPPGRQPAASPLTMRLDASGSCRHQGNSAPPARAVLGGISVRHHACKAFTRCLLVARQASPHEPATILQNGYSRSRRGRGWRTASWTPCPAPRC